MNTAVKEQYKKKLISIEEFAKLIKSGDTLMNALGPGACSRELHEAILARADELENVTHQDTVQIKPSPFHDPDTVMKLRGHIDTQAYFFLNPVRKIGAKKITDFIPVMAEDCTQVITSRATVFTFMCTPPNDRGYVNLGVCNFFTKDLLMEGREKGALRIAVAEVNDQMPIVFGDNWVPMDKIDYFVEKSSPLPLFTRGKASEIETRIGDYVLDLIEDGACVQMGIGGITEAVIARLDCKRELGINSEMIPMGLNELIEKGVVTNSNKIDLKGESTATFGMGDQALYDLMTENPAVTLYPTKYLNHPITIAKNPKVTAINMAIFVDLTGQIVSEGIGHREVSGAGGQLDFQIGAYWSEGGKGLTLLTSARELGNGNLASSIVPEFPGGSPITVPRAYADYVITEYGVAHLRGKSRRERAEALINIAHPDFRADLRKAAQSAFYPD
jgi:4-hydroxybutyrate CoA-transferase